MALLATLPTTYGETRELYVRLNNLDQVANHGVPVVARFRGYVSKEAFNAGAAFVWEQVIEFDSDAPDEPWKLAYRALVEADYAAAAREKRAAAQEHRDTYAAAVDAYHLPTAEDLAGAAGLPKDATDAQKARAETTKVMAEAVMSRHAQMKAELAGIDAELPKIDAAIEAGEKLTAALRQAKDA